MRRDLAVGRRELPGRSPSAGCRVVGEVAVDRSRRCRISPVARPWFGVMEISSLKKKNALPRPSISSRNHDRTTEAAAEGVDGRPRRGEAVQTVEERVRVERAVAGSTRSAVPL